MRAYVVVEGSTDVIFLKVLLPIELQERLVIVPGGGRTNLASVARTLLVTKREPLAVLTDTDSVDESGVLERRQQTEELVQAVSGGVPVKVFVIAPEIEVLLFRVPEALERITGHALSADNLALARYQPKQVIQQLGQDKAVTIEQIIADLTPEELETIRETSPIKELIAFLTEQVALKQVLPA